MTDLYIAIFVVALISAALLGLGLWLGRRLPARRVVFLIMLTMLVMLAFQKFASDKLWLTKVLPFSSAVVLGNLFPPLAAFMGGLAWKCLTGAAWRRIVLVVPLVTLSWYGAARIVVGSPPPMRNWWVRGVCRQTSRASCSAAAGATLLRAYGIRTTEKEMADLCLTRPDGTSMLGLYRGLKIKTAGTPWKPESFTGDIQSLRELSTQGPLLLSVELLPGEPLAPQYEAWDWAVGQRHSVVLFHFLPNDEVQIGDPDAGRERWSIDDLRVLWHGEGIRLVPRG